jgi:hypothetical protein
VADAVYYIPIVTTILSAGFAWIVLQRWLLKRQSTHLLWWAIGIFVYGLGTFAEGFTALFGWHEPIFKLWYVVGALLGGAPLAQGTVYLLLPRKVATRLAIGFVIAATICAVFVILSPVDASLADNHKLAGDVMDWTWVRALAPFLNLYAFIFLVGGAAYSAFKFHESRENRRMAANIFIAVGALLPGIGGSFTVFGLTEVLYVTEFVGIILIYAGYRFSITGRPAPNLDLQPALA